LLLAPNPPKTGAGEEVAGFESFEPTPELKGVFGLGAAAAGAPKLKTGAGGGAGGGAEELELEA